MLFKPTEIKEDISGRGGRAVSEVSDDFASCLLRFLLLFPLDGVMLRVRYWLMGDSKLAGLLASHSRTKKLVIR